MRLLLIEGQASHRKQLNPWNSVRSQNNRTSCLSDEKRVLNGKLSRELNILTFAGHRKYNAFIHKYYLIQIAALQLASA